MPCKNPTAKIIVKVNEDDIFLGYEYRKITCSKAIGETGYEDYCRGKSIDEIVSIEFDGAIREMSVNDLDGQFFLYLEWEALLAALCLYKGYECPVDDARYEISGIEYGPECIAIYQLTVPPEEMPSIIPCCKIPKNH